MGDFTNWKPKPLFEIIDYTESLEPQFDKHYVINMMMFENVLDHTKDQTYKFEDDDKFIFSGICVWIFPECLVFVLFCSLSIAFETCCLTYS